MEDAREIQELIQKGLKELQSMKVRFGLGTAEFCVLILDLMDKRGIAWKYMLMVHRNRGRRLSVSSSSWID